MSIDETWPPTLDEFIKWRDNWANVMLHQAPEGGWAVVLKLDGYYADRADAEAVRVSFERKLTGYGLELKGH